MKRNPILLSAQPIQLNYDVFIGDNPIISDVQLTRDGTFHSNRFGEFSLNLSVYEDFIRNFHEGVYGNDLDVGLPYNAEHRSELGALGWIKELYVRWNFEKNWNELWATVEWTPFGVQAIREKRYKYSSIEYYDEWTDPETLKVYKNVVIGAALTVDPFISKMSEIKLSKNNESEEFELAEEVVRKDNSEDLKILLGKLQVEKDNAIKEYENQKNEFNKFKSEFENMKIQLNKEIELRKESEKLIHLAKIEKIDSKVKSFVESISLNSKGEYRIKQDNLSTVENFVRDLMQIDEGIKTFSKEDKLSEKFISIMNSIEPTKVSLSSEGHSLKEADEPSMGANPKNVSEPEKNADDQDKMVRAYAKKNNMNYAKALNEMIDIGLIE